MLLVLFDIDGTLLREGVAAKIAFARALRETYATSGPVGTFRFAGMTDPECVTEIMRLAGIAEDVIHQRRDECLRRYVEHLDAVVHVQLAARVLGALGVDPAAAHQRALGERAGAAAGGSITLTGGAAARNTSGNADGGSVVIVGGAGIGTGVAGGLMFGGTASTNPGFFRISNTQIVRGNGGYSALKDLLAGDVTASTFEIGANGPRFSVISADTSLTNSGISLSCPCALQR